MREDSAAAGDCWNVPDARRKPGPHLASGAGAASGTTDASICGGGGGGGSGGGALAPVAGASFRPESSSTCKKQHKSLWR